MLRSVHLVCPQGHHRASAADSGPRDAMILGIGMAIGAKKIPPVCGICGSPDFTIIDGAEYATEEEAVSAFQEITASERAEKLRQVGRN